MITRRMNQRITIYSVSGGQNDDGEVVDNIRKDLYTCWAEALKTQLRDFKTQANDSLDNSKVTKVFLIRYNPKIEIDNTMFVEHNLLIYKIDKVEANESDKDMTMISTVKIS